MCNFSSTDTFNRQITNLIKRPKDGYSSVKEDICKEFRGKTYQEIFNSPEMVKDERHIRIIKMRLRNSAQNLSKRDGYRLIYLIHKESKDIVLLYVYPKRGNKGQSTVSENDILNFIECYIENKESNTLTAFYD